MPTPPPRKLPKSFSLLLREAQPWVGSPDSAKVASRRVNAAIQVIDSPTRGEALLDLLLTNTEELIQGIKIHVSLGCSDRACGGIHNLEGYGPGEE